MPSTPSDDRIPEFRNPAFEVSPWYQTAYRRWTHTGRHRSPQPSVPFRSRATAAGGATAATVIALAGVVATTQALNDGRAGEITGTAGTSADLLAERREETRAARRERPEPARTGRVATPKAATRPKPPESPKPEPPSPPAPPPEPPAPDWVVPAKNYSVTSGFGPRWGTAHEGVDLAAPTGTPIKAAHEGTVETSGWYGGYGYAVIIDHGEGVKTLYGHNSDLLVSEGEDVDTGDRIAEMGSTGDSTGPHLHFEVHIDGEPVNPVPWMGDKGVDF